MHRNRIMTIMATCRIFSMNIVFYANVKRKNLVFSFVLYIVLTYLLFNVKKLQMYQILQGCENRLVKKFPEIRMFPKF